MPLDEFVIWNPSLADPRTSACAFKSGARYCGKLYFGSVVAPEPGPLYELPIRVSWSATAWGNIAKAEKKDGAIDTCTDYEDVPDGWDW